MTQTQTALKAAIEACVAQGQDPRRYRDGLARRFGSDLDTVDALIKSVWDGSVMHPEDAAQAALRYERTAAQSDPQAARDWAHEE
jgi:hypothetical protein